MANKSKAPLIGLALTLLFFGIFIYWLISPSAEQTLIEKIQLSTTVEEVKMLYLNGKSEFTETDENGKTVPSVYLQDAVREKLTSMDLSQTEIHECLKWIPPKKMNLNLIVVPDFSLRMKDYPDQDNFDIKIIEQVFRSFKAKVQLKQDSKDLLCLEITDEGQVGSEFSQYANNLRVDLSSHIGKSNRLFFENVYDESKFQNTLKGLYKKVSELYAEEDAKRMGADFSAFFRRVCNDKNGGMKKNDFYNGYQNKILILTDGYLESKSGYQTAYLMDKDRYTPEERSRWRKLKETVIFGEESILKLIKEYECQIMAEHDVNLSNVEIMIAEIRERESGRDKDATILSVYWKDWLTRMGIGEGNLRWERHQSSLDETLKKIDDFVMN
jgi:hypothetical protein